MTVYVVLETHFSGKGDITRLDKVFKNEIDAEKYADNKNKSTEDICYDFWPQEVE